MASVKWSGLVSEVKGVLNGSILSVGYGGQTIRNRRSQIGAISAAWSLSRSRLQYVSGIWRGLTSLQQQAWNDAAPDFPYTNKFGNSVIPSGFQLFCQQNSNLWFLALGPNTAPSGPYSQDNLGTMRFSFPTPGALSLYYQSDGSGDQLVVVYMSQALSKGKRTVPRYLRKIYSDYDVNSGTTNITADWTAVFGALPASGRLFYRVCLIDARSGQRWEYLSGFVDIA